MPRFVSVDEKGEEHEFLTEYYGDAGKMLSMEFRKGYEWPFDSRKAKDGSSVIDLLVYTETKIKGRRVYLDFRKNPMGFEELPFDNLAPEAYDYLQNAGALFGTPLERLGHMNQPAIDLYLEKGVDLSREMLEIALCAQHNNGGADVDMWWQSGIPGLFVAGEAAGTHGVYRPGGSALNAGQVGSMRAAQYIAKRRPLTPLTPEELFAACREDVEKEAYVLYNARRKENTASRLLSWARERMSKYGGAIRSPEAVKRTREETLRVFRDWESTGCGDCPRDLYLLKDALICQIMLLYAMENYAAEGGKTRGSALCVDPDGEAPAGFPRSFAFVTDGGEKDGLTQIVSFENGEPQAVWRPVRPLPEGGGFFENVWRSFRENGNIY
ncbi:MAG: FAD-binding protein [Clostridia bacterium]|nr:FAD-binding protein [Clostridia bacterium]